MRVLDRKLLRDLRSNAVTLLCVVAIIAVGTGSFLGLGTAQRMLERSQERYYRDYRLADFWIELNRAPREVVERLRQWPELRALEDRVRFEVILDVPDAERPLSGRLLSLESARPGAGINGIHLVRGSGFSEDRDEELILNEAFAKAHHLEIGDRLPLILNQRQVHFTIVGTAISPEYTYMVRGSGDLVPDPEHFAVLWVEGSYARDVLGYRDACNQIVGEIAPGYAHATDEILDRMERVLAPYGVAATTPRDRQASHRILADEIEGLGVTAAVLPGIFLGVAALVLNILMTRLAERQRTVMGTLKAMGYPSGQLRDHYLRFGLAVGLLGGGAGILLGRGLTSAMMKMYREFFSFPAFHRANEGDLMLLALAISIAFALLGSWRGTRRVLALHPADAMRSRPAERGGAIALEAWPWLWRRFGFRTQMALRQVFRNRGRTATAALSSGMAVALILMALVLYAAFFDLVEHHFETTTRSDVDLGLRHERGLAALDEAAALPGVLSAEALLAAPGELRHGLRKRRVGITGLSRGHRLSIPRLANGDPVTIPERGLVLSQTLADLLDAKVGDELWFHPESSTRRPCRVRVASTIESYIGLECYADRQEVARLLDDANALGGIQLEVAACERSRLYAELKELPLVQGISVRADTRRNLEKTLVETSLASIVVMVLFAGIMAFGGTLTNALMELGDRMREVSTLRVLGYTPGEVSGLFWRQSLLVSTLGILLGLPLGYGMIAGISKAYDTELYRVPISVQPGALLLTVLTTYFFVGIAQFIVHRSIHRLDWAEGIKIKE